MIAYWNNEISMPEKVHRKCAVTCGIKCTKIPEYAFYSTTFRRCMGDDEIKYKYTDLWHTAKKQKDTIFMMPF